jgi:hypothetical protein
MTSGKRSYPPESELRTSSAVGTLCPLFGFLSRLGADRFDNPIRQPSHWKSSLDCVDITGGMDGSGADNVGVAAAYVDSVDAWRPSVLPRWPSTES